MKTWKYAAPLLLASAVFSASATHPDRDRPSLACAQLAPLLLAQHKVLAASAAIKPAAGNVPAYCEVNLTQKPAINVRVGLPLSTADGGTGGVKGAWNGKVQNLGGGAYAGNLGPVGGPVSAGYVGSSTDTGHGAAWCNAIDPETGLPNAQPNCGLAGGGFVLSPANRLIRWQVKDFIEDSLVAQTNWALDLARWYYGQKAERNYWVGCSTGGRQGLELAQSHPHLFDGFLVGAPAINWNRFIIGAVWAPVVAKDLVGNLSPAKSAAANNAAIAACDADDGVADGIVDEPRRCRFDATALLCTGKPGDPATCLTRAEADAVNRIWDGPRDVDGERLWGGPNKGTTFGLLITPTGDPNALNLAYVQYWLHQDPLFDWRTIDLGTYPSEFEASYRKFRRSAASDDVHLDGVRARGAKIIHYHGVADPLVIPFGSYNYAGRLFDRYGMARTQSFMRSFFYPGVSHCAGGNGPQPDTTVLLNKLVDWVENDVAPEHVVARQTLPGGAVRTRKICKYPDQAVYKGTGSTDDEASFECRVNRTVPPDLAHDARTNKDR